MPLETSPIILGNAPPLHGQQLDALERNKSLTMMQVVRVAGWHKPVQMKARRRISQKQMGLPPENFLSLCRAGTSDQHSHPLPSEECSCWKADRKRPKQPRPI